MAALGHCPTAGGISPLGSPEFCKKGRCRLTLARGLRSAYFGVPGFVDAQSFARTDVVPSRGLLAVRPHLGLMLPMWRIEVGAMSRDSEATGRLASVAALSAERGDVGPPCGDYVNLNLGSSRWGLRLSRLTLMYHVFSTGLGMLKGVLMCGSGFACCPRDHR